MALQPSRAAPPAAGNARWRDQPAVYGLSLGALEQGYRAAGDKRSADGIRELGPMLQPGESLVAIANGFDNDPPGENRVHCLLVATDRRVLQLGLVSGVSATMIRRHIWTVRSSPYPTITRYRASYTKGMFGRTRGQGWTLVLTMASDKPVTRSHPAPTTSTGQIPAQSFPGLQEAILDRLLPSVRQEAVDRLAAQQAQHSPPTAT